MKNEVVCQEKKSFTTPPFFLIHFGVCGMQTHLAAQPTLSSRFHKANLSESFYIGAEEYKRLLSDIEIDVLNLKVVRPEKPF